MAKKARPVGPKRAIKRTKKKLRRMNESLHQGPRQTKGTGRTTADQTAKANERVRAALDELDATVKKVKREIGDALTRRPVSN
ncbi:MAG TPA: hypothetical protein VIB48_05015 [Acidimicrobiia bacterium]|jgi:hypothetical protein